MDRSTLNRFSHRLAGSMLACSLGFSGTLQAAPERLVERQVSNQLAGKFLELADIDREIEVFVRLDKKSVAALQFDSIEASGKGLDADAQKAAARRISSEQQRLIQDLASLGGEVRGTMRVAANGVRIRIQRSQIPHIAALRGVRAVSLVDTHVIGNHFNSVPWIGAPVVWDQIGDGENVSVGIIDTGIDYLHANFGGSGDVAEFEANDETVIEPGSFPTTKVVGGYDFVGDAYDGNNEPQPDPDPLDCNGHGSHVGGSAAGLGVGSVIGPGVAKGADLYALRVFGCDGSTRETSAAIEWAMDPNGDGDMSDHLDVINMSLGSSNGYPNDPTAIASNNAARAGVIVVASAGNSGDAPYITGSPGVAERAISVAAYASGGTVPAINVSGSLTADAEYIEGSSPVRIADETISGDFVIPGVNAATGVRDGCEPFAEDMTGKVALISRGACAFATKSANAEAQGAASLVVYNDGANPGRIAPIAMAGLEEAAIPSIMIPSFIGDAITASLADDANAQVTGLADQSTTTETLFGDVIADFSSRGPGSGGSGFKPDLGTSGVNITSAQVGSGDGPLTISGTSMSAPHVAGAAALLRQQHPYARPALIEGLLQNSTRDSNDLNAALGPFPLSRGGVGVVDIAKAITLDAVAYPGGVSFGRLNPAIDMRRYFRFRLESLTGGARSFDVTHRPNQTVAGVEVNCGRPVAVTGNGWSNSVVTSIRVEMDVSEMPIDFGNSSQQEVDGHCIFTDGKDTLRVGYSGVVDPTSQITMASKGRNAIRFTNWGYTAGFAELFTRVGRRGTLLNGTSNAIDSVGFRSTDPADFFDLDVIEFGLVTERAWDALMGHEIDIAIDGDFDGVPEALLVVADRGLFGANPSLTGEMVTVQLDLVDGGGFLDWTVPGIDFNDRAGYFAFTKASSGGLVPDRFAYTMTTFGPDGSVDLQTGVVDPAEEVQFEISSFGLLPKSGVLVESAGAGEVLALFTNNRVRQQRRTLTVR